MAWSRQFPRSIRWNSGDDLPLRFLLQTDAAGDSVTSLADYEVRCTVKAGPNDSDADALPARSTADGTMQIVGAAVLWNYSETETAAAPKGVDLYLKLHVTDPSGTTLTPVRGRVHFYP